MTKNLTDLIIGVDLDGVCADYYRRMREIAAEWFECRVEDLPTEVSYGLKEWGIDDKDRAQYESLHRWAVNQRGLFVTAPMITGARKYLRLLSNEGARIRIITHRLTINYFHSTAVSQTIVWLDKNGIPYKDLCFMKDKEQVGAQVYVEDAPENVTRLRKTGQFTICFGNTTNRDSGMPRVGTWKQVYEIIHENFGAQGATTSLPHEKA